MPLDKDCQLCPATMYVPDNTEEPNHGRQADQMNARRMQAHEARLRPDRITKKDSAPQRRTDHNKGQRTTKKDSADAFKQQALMLATSANACS